jgi:hypothetical protein
MKNELEKRYATLEPEELIKIVNAPGGYTTDAINLAVAELRSRNLSLQKLLSSNKLSNIDLIKIALETDREEYINVISEELKKRNIWNSITDTFQTELGYSSKKLFDEVLPEGIRFTQKLEELLTINQSNLTKNENLNILLIIFSHIAKNIVDDKEKSAVFLRVHIIGINSSLILQIIEPFYHRVKSSLSKQKPNSKSYTYALFAGFLSTIIGGVSYGSFMIYTNYKHGVILMLLGLLSGVSIQVLTGGKNGVGIAFIGVCSTVLSIYLGNIIFAVYKNSQLPVTKYDFIWGTVGLVFVIGYSHMIKTKKQ